MQHAASCYSDRFPELLARLPPDIELDVLAAEHKAIERCREVGDGATLLRLAFARGPGELSLRDTASWASAAGIAALSNPAVKYRLDKSVEFLKAILERQLAAAAGSQDLLWPGRSLRAADGTTISKPGSSGTDWRVHGVFDLGAGGFTTLELTDGRGAESLGRGRPVAGEVRIGDRYFARARDLAHYREVSHGAADFIVRVRWNGFRLTRPNGRKFDLIKHLRALPQRSATHEVEVRAAVQGTQTLPLRLIILRKTPEQAAATIKQLRTRANRKQQQLDPRSEVAAHFLILATSLAAADYPADEILTAYRLRWQIELAFKRLKSLLHIDRMPTHTDRASRSWLYAHLILALICDDLSQEVLESFP
jgi:hypothetical protein